MSEQSSKTSSSPKVLTYVLLFAVLALMWPLQGQSVEWAFGLEIPAWLVAIVFYGMGLLLATVSPLRKPR